MSDTNNSSEAMQYPNSNMQDKQLGVDESGDNWQYPSASSSGYVEITLPALHGPNSEERMLVKDFGVRVAQEVERSLAPNLYPKASPRTSATVTFRHYLGAAQGATLLDAGALWRPRKWRSIAPCHWLTRRTVAGDT